MKIIQIKSNYEKKLVIVSPYNVEQDKIGYIIFFMLKNLSK